MGEGVIVEYTGRSEVQENHGGSKYIKIDFTNNDEIAQFESYVRQNDYDILINNCGINKISPISKLDRRDFEEIIHVNLTVPSLLISAVSSSMCEKGWGRIVNVGSIWGKISKEHRAAYSASKHGIDGVTAAVAAEVARFGVLVNTVSPGFVRTKLTESVLGKQGMAEMAEAVPIRRLAEPTEIANFVNWLCSDDNSYISGQNLLIDGGFSRV